MMLDWSEDQDFRKFQGKVKSKKVLLSAKKAKEKRSKKIVLKDYKTFIVKSFKDSLAVRNDSLNHFRASVKDFRLAS